MLMVVCTSCYALCVWSCPYSFIHSLRVRSHGSGLCLLNVTVVDNGICEASLLNPPVKCTPTSSKSAEWSRQIDGLEPLGVVNSNLLLSLKNIPSTIMFTWLALMTVPSICFGCVLWKRTRRVLGYEKLEKVVNLSVQLFSLALTLIASSSLPPLPAQPLNDSHLFSV